jgi:hypothetical protein
MSQRTRINAFIHDGENTVLIIMPSRQQKYTLALKHDNLSDIRFLAKGKFFLLISSRPMRHLLELPRCFNGRWFYIRKSLGSVTYPVRAEAAAVYGDAR